MDGHGWIIIHLIKIDDHLESNFRSYKVETKLLFQFTDRVPTIIEFRQNNGPAQIR